MKRIDRHDRQTIMNPTESRSLAYHFELMIGAASTVGERATYTKLRNVCAQLADGVLVLKFNLPGPELALHEAVECLKSLRAYKDNQLMQVQIETVLREIEGLI
jgi:hypothetical protein